MYCQFLLDWTLKSWISQDKVVVLLVCLKLSVKPQTATCLIAQSPMDVQDHLVEKEVSPNMTAMAAQLQIHLARARENNVLNDARRWLLQRCCSIYFTLDFILFVIFFSLYSCFLNTSAYTELSTRSSSSISTLRGWGWGWVSNVSPIRDASEKTSSDYNASRSHQKSHQVAFCVTI
jgi:hypothetical protein